MFVVTVPVPDDTVDDVVDELDVVLQFTDPDPEPEPEPEPRCAPVHEPE